MATGFPTADQIAHAIVAACRLTGDGPVATCMRQTSRARHIAFAGLCEAFPEAKKTNLARLTGYAKPDQYSGHVMAARRAAWWSEDWVRQVASAARAA